MLCIQIESLKKGNIDGKKKEKITAPQNIRTYFESEFELFTLIKKESCITLSFLSYRLQIVSVLVLWQKFTADANMNYMAAYMIHRRH